MHVACQRTGFSLLEMIVVMGIIAILMTLLAPTVNSARKNARQADCRSNLRQFGIALTAYRADHAGKNPAWMSNLYPKYIDARDVYVCKSDPNRGEGAIVPKRLVSAHHVSSYPETIDNSQNRVSSGETSEPRHAEQNRDVAANSYFYEFSAADCSWKPGMTWNEAKEQQLQIGDTANGGGDPGNPVPYSTSRMPIIRCWHHWDESVITGYGDENAKIGNHSSRLPMTINVAYAGNVFVAPPWWEGRLEPGVRRLAQ